MKTCQHTHRTLLNEKMTVLCLTMKLYRCDDCRVEWTETIDAPERLYTCNGDCIDCPGWKEDKTCDKG